MPWIFCLWRNKKKSVYSINIPIRWCVRGCCSLIFPVKHIEMAWKIVHIYRGSCSTVSTNKELMNFDFTRGICRCCRITMIFFQFDFISCTLKRITGKKWPNVDWIIAATQRSWNIHCLTLHSSIHFNPIAKFSFSSFFSYANQNNGHWLTALVDLFGNPQHFFLFFFRERVPITTKLKLKLPSHRLVHLALSSSWVSTQPYPIEIFHDLKENRRETGDVKMMLSRFHT